MPFKSELPNWENKGQAPSSSKRIAGWLAQDRPPAEWMNWFFNRVYKFLQEIQERGISKDEYKEVEDFRKDSAGTTHADISKRLSSEISILKKENAKLVESTTATAIPLNAGTPTFSRATTRTYKGRTYPANNPVFDMGGLLVDPSLSESFTIPTANVLNANEGTVEIGIVPLVLADTVNYCRIDFPTSGRFLLFVSAKGTISFSIDEWSGGYIATGAGVAKVNELFTASLRWNHKAKEYSLFVNGKKIGVKYYDKTVKGDFGSTMSVVHNNAAVVTKLRFSNIARSDKELTY
ncbi:hypothetical protein [Priestia megaterium]|uniref:hypothetical protein n=1 Tax=Priestia megaterium TaxID=1404 RepID=UPI000BF4C65C|nr:hypothetical protein [Priestia megaterium]PFJ03220.1 hypothetical protein COI84_02715 [Priestia megaterium]PGR11755.1 hypothetical protein COC62_14120 [Priestia megaterium]